MNELGPFDFWESAGARTFAPSGNGYVTPSLPPIAIEKATSDGSFIVFTQTDPRRRLPVRLTMV